MECPSQREDGLTEWAGKGVHIAASMGRGGECIHTQEQEFSCHLSVIVQGTTLFFHVHTSHEGCTFQPTFLMLLDCMLCLFDTVELLLVAFGIALHTHTHTHTRPEDASVAYTGSTGRPGKNGTTHTHTHTHPPTHPHTHTHTQCIAFHTHMPPMSMSTSQLFVKRSGEAI